jgi:hypothetical protein
MTGTSALLETDLEPHLLRFMQETINLGRARQPKEFIARVFITIDNRKILFQQYYCEGERKSFEATVMLGSLMKDTLIKTLNNEENWLVPQRFGGI